MPNSVNCKSVVLLGSIHLMFGLSVTIWTVVFIIWTIFLYDECPRRNELRDYEQFVAQSWLEPFQQTFINMMRYPKAGLSHPNFRLPMFCHYN